MARSIAEMESGGQRRVLLAPLEATDGDVVGVSCRTALMHLGVAVTLAPGDPGRTFSVDLPVVDLGRLECLRPVRRLEQGPAFIVCQPGSLRRGGGRHGPV